jgi:H+/Cl- antiporter ClcA
MTATTESPPSPDSPPSPPFTRTREFWVLVGSALALGVYGAVAGLVFMGVAVHDGGKWYSDTDPRWFGGHWWWIAATAGAGIVVGLIRQLMKLPDKLPGLVEDLQAEEVDPRLVPGTVLVSAVSLIGGASLGPEKALSYIGGGAGTWLSRRRKYSKDDTRLNTLTGMAGAFGGLFSAVVIVAMLILEIARPGGGQRFSKALLGTIVASSVSFGIYFAIIGAVFLDAYKVPHYNFHDWQMLAAIPLGLFAAVVCALLAVVGKLTAVLVGRVKLPGVAKATVGGALFGLVGVILPLTMFTGTDQLKTVIKDAGTLGIGLLAVIVIAKMLTFAVANETGFVGGPLFVALFLGGTAGVLVHEVIPGVPLALAFTCMLAAVAGGLISAPFSMVLISAFLTQVGALQTAPILIAVITSYLTVEGVKYLIASRQQAAAGAAKPAANQTVSPDGHGAAG